MNVLNVTNVRPVAGGQRNEAASHATPSVDTTPVVRKVAAPWDAAGPARPMPGAAAAPAAKEQPVTTTTTLNGGAQEQTMASATKPNQLYLATYDIPGVGNGLTSLTFPVRIDAAQQRVAAGDAGTFYAMQFAVKDEKGKSHGQGYIGLQPREDGKARVAFSGFGAQFSAPGGTAKADGGPGASNSTSIDFVFGNKYELTIERDSTNHALLKAYVRDVTDPAKPGPRQDVKSLSLDKKVLLGGHAEVFIEHYGKSISKSSEIGRTKGSFYAPGGTSEKGETIDGKLYEGRLSGRYKQSTTGERTVTKIGQRIVELQLEIQGAKEPPASKVHAPTQTPVTGG